MGRPGRRNAGWFRHGLTTDEHRRGGHTSFTYLLAHKPEVLLGLRKKLRQQQAQQRHAQEEEEERRAEAARERQLAHDGEQYPTTAAEHGLF
jgi:hypothetical protein